MKNDIKILKNVELFKGLENDLEKMLSCLGAYQKHYVKDNVILLTGDKITSIGVILYGTVKIINEDIDGNINILTEFKESDTFAEGFVCAGIERSPVTIIASSKCEVMFIDYKRIVSMCSSVCSFHTTLIKNMLKLIAEKNILLNQKMNIISKRSIREKLLSYFNTQSAMVNSKKFTIPFNRVELSSFLCIDRSAMTRELYNMRDDGLIDFDKNQFELLQ